MFTKASLLSTLFLLPLCTASCGQLEDLVEDDTSDGAIATTQSAICTDSGGARFYFAELILGDVGGTVSATSPTTYGSPLCPGRFVVEATGTAGKPNLSASARYAGLSLGQTVCGSGSVSMLVYAFDGVAWAQLGDEHTASGVWTPNPLEGGPSYCQIEVGIGVPGTPQKVLVAAKAAKQTLSAQVTGIISAHY